MNLGLHDRVYVITGGSRGLGFATAQALTEDGARVVISSRQADRVKQAVAELGGPDRAAGVVADVADPDGAERLVLTALRTFGRLDGALLSTGGPPLGEVVTTDDETWRRAFESIHLGPLRVARRCVAELDEGGSIAFVLSTSVRQPIRDYSTSNGLRPGLAGAAKTMADEVGHRGIRVNGLLPGSIATDRLRELDAGPTPKTRSLATIPLGRYGEPAEFGKVAAFVLSPAASYITGSMIPVDGGVLRGV